MIGLERIVKTAIFIISLIPLAWLILQAFTTGLGANPVEKVIHRTGDWALNFLMITLSITPLRHLFGWTRLTRLRRMIGLFSFFYASLHFITYLGIEQALSWKAIVADVTKHKRIIVGFVGFILLIPLAITSTNCMIQRLGVKRWQALHKLVYLIAVGGVTHYLWLVKRDMRTPLIYAGVLIVLLGYRVLAWWFGRSARRGDY